jgi:Skp family chaperone for outer membrane proteins
MSRLHGWALMLTIALAQCGTVGIAVAQQSPPPTARPTAGPTVALIDIGYIFNNYTRFKSSMAEVKTDIERLKADAQTQKDELNRLGQRLQQYRSGTPEYEAIDAEIAKRQAELTAKFQLRNRDIARRQAKILLDVYKEITEATNDYMQRHNIDIVLRFNGDPVEPEQPDSVREFITRPVVSYRTDLDITPAILQYLNRAAPSQPTPDRQQGGPYR